MDEDVISGLTGFALDEFLGEFTGERGIKTSGLSSLGFGAKGSGVDASQIYNDKFADDDEGGPDPSSFTGALPRGGRGFADAGDDWEDEIDKELDDEDFRKTARPAATTSGFNTRTTLRGEDDDFDEDDDDAGPGQGGDAASTTAQPSMHFDTGLALPFSIPDADEILQIKQEEVDLEDGEYAQQQALFAQSYARMQQQQETQALNFPLMLPPPLMDVTTIYPSFSPDKILNFTELFTTRPRKRQRMMDPLNELYPIPQPSSYSVAPSSRDFRSHEAYDRSSAVAQYLLEALREQAEGGSEDEGEDVDLAFRKLVETANGTGWKIPTNTADERDTIAFEDWEDGIVWDSQKHRLPNGHAYPDENHDPRTSKSVRFEFQNPDIESGEWTKGIIWSEKTPFKDFTKLQLTLNDPSGPASVEDRRPPPEAARIVIKRTTADPLNLSNDKLYEVRREQKKTVRQTFGHLEVQHAYPAMKLQFPWYKTRLSKAELRSFHRMPIQFPTNIPLSFSKVRSAKKKKDKTGRKLKKDSVGAEAFRTFGDLSLRDTGGFVLLEYSEEHPPILPNPGMGSIIVNYYRKTDVADSYVPKAEMGEAFLLDPSDESPFLRFGQVEPGQMIPALYNNLVRAPLFRHDAYTTDFLVIKTTANGETKFYVRDIKHIFVVGQTYPLTDVPGPQSRKLTATAKHRLQSITYKLVSKNPRRRVKIGKLLKYFPDQTEMQMRQRLKEFMEYNRAGDDQGFWKIKAGKMPEEDELFKLITPEQIVLAESTQVGQRNLLDAGFSATVDEDKGKDNEESTLDVRQQLAPWFTTKNFLNATQNKAMLKLHGEGDPSCRGEGFSFLRVSMKDIFLRAGERKEDRQAEIDARPKSAHRYNVAEQQQIYREEITRIWRSQYDSLSSPYEPMVTEEDEIRWRQEESKMELTSNTPAATPFTPGEGMSPGFSRSASPGADGMPKGPPKILRIRRQYNGIWRSEIVRDQGVIKGYLRQKLLHDDGEDQEPESLQLTGDPEKDKIVRKKLAEQLEKLRKNQERRLQRKNAKMGVTGDVFLPGGKKIKPETTRKCGNCGQIGHMKTNRKCPKWAEFNAQANQEPGANVPAGPANPFAVGLPGLSGMQAGSP